MTINQLQDEIIDEFVDIEDWMDRYQYLVDLGGELEGLSAEEKNDDTLIKGCQSQVWLVCDEQDGKLYFRGESDAIIVKGIVALLINMMSGCTAEEVVKYDFGFLDKIGLKEHLSPTRSNGLVSMVEKMKLYALKMANLSKENQELLTSEISVRELIIAKQRNGAVGSINLIFRNSLTRFENYASQ